MIIVEKAFTCGHFSKVTDGQRESFTIETKPVDRICDSCDRNGQPYVENTAGLEMGYEAGRQARNQNAAAYYGSPVERSDNNGCSCTPNNGPNCQNCA